MNNSRALYNTRACCRLSAVVMVLTVLLPLVAPVPAVMATEGSAISKSANVLPAWWVNAEPEKGSEPGLRGALPGWWQSLEPAQAQWDVTGVAGAGQTVPDSGAATEFTPAPNAGELGAIAATPVAAGAGDSTDQLILQTPQLIVSKSGKPDPVPAGESLGYSIVYTNVGDAEAPSVVVTETYDANVSYDLSDIPPTQGDNVWDLGGLAPGESGRLFVVVRVDDSLEPDTVLNNVVTVGGPGVGQYAFTETTAVASTPELTLTLSGSPNPVDAGADLYYRLHYENQGTAPVNGVQITMTYDAHVSFYSSIPPPRDGTNDVWDVGRVTAGSGGDINIRVRVDAYMEDLYTLTTSGTITSDELGAYTVYQYNVVHAPALELAKRAATDPVLAGERLVYTLVYTNVGSVPVSGLLLTDAVPANSDYVRCQPLPCSRSADIVTWWEAGDLADGASRTATMVVDVHLNVDSGTALTNAARVRVYGTPAYSATAQITTTVISSPSLWLSIDNGTDDVKAGDELRYVLDYGNDGNGKAYDVRIVVTPPSPDVAMDPYCEPASDCVFSGGKLIYHLGTVPGGKTDSRTMLVKMRDPLPAGADAITASAVISTVTPEDPPGDNHAQDADTIATRPDLVVSAEYPELMPWPGKRVTYTLEYKNEGHIATTGAVLTATRHRRTVFDETASHACWEPQDARRYRCALGDLDYGDSGERLFVVTLSKYFTSTITNFDAVFAVGDDGVSGADANPDDNVLRAPMGIPNLVIEDVVVERSVWKRQAGWFTATIRNEGPGWACGNGGSDNSCDNGFWLDLYLNVITPFVSYDLTAAGDCWVVVGPIAPGATATPVISFTGTYTDYYYRGFCGPAREGDLGPALRNIQLVIDNVILTDTYDYGWVAEYDELDNFKLETPPYDIFLPIVFCKLDHYVVSGEPMQSCVPPSVGYGIGSEPDRQSLDNGAHNVYDR